jgi:hypothetical protein
MLIELTYTLTDENTEFDFPLQGVAIYTAMATRSDKGFVRYPPFEVVQLSWNEMWQSDLLAGSTKYVGPVLPLQSYRPW